MIEEKYTKKAVLVVSFGTSYSGSRKKTIEAVEEEMKASFPGYQIRRAFSSPTILRILEKRDNLKIDNPEQALKKLKEEGFQRVVISPTYIMSGYEYEGMVKAAETYRDCFMEFSIGKPLLSKEEDYREVVELLVSATKGSADHDTAIVFMGHGTDHEANDCYSRLAGCFKAQGHAGYIAGTVEAAPGIEDVVKELKENKWKKAVLLPFMVVAGDHAVNDMAGEAENSWKSVLQSEGYQVECVIKGLGEYEGIRNLFVKHALEAAESVFREKV